MIELHYADLEVVFFFFNQFGKLLALMELNGLDENGKNWEKCFFGSPG